MENKKKETLIRKLASYFLSKHIDENIASVRDLGKIYGASIGLISETIAFIEESGGVRINRRGQLGSTIQDMSIGKLWKIASSGPLVIANTLPSNRRYEGLAAAIKSSYV